MRVKICGITTPRDALAAADAGAHYLGLIRAASKRQIAPDAISAVLERLPENVQPVLLYMNQEQAQLEAEIKQFDIRTVQLHGSEPAEFVLRLQQRFPEVRIIRAWAVSGKQDGAEIAAYLEAVHHGKGEIHAVILDAPKGGPHPGYPTLQRAAQQVAAQGFQVWCAGGLTAENLAEAVPPGVFHGVDVASGVEKAPGVKDALAVRKFVQIARAIPPAPRS